MGFVWLNLLISFHEERIWSRNKELSATAIGQPLRSALADVMRKFAVQ